ncbi:MAG: hypothetical protein PHF33_00280 [Candidatus Delongbacteria bacterium]|jgi:hypothetical protein|nr:hypothetical protein [Candidatus Delongbacteria bacterium]MDD4205221.1 hypothetical protein [Candidatus Delongbacteria bacterium]MDY0016998.1 hypothetical protein [Candidatus Delongbacteria bacterium]
MDFFKKIFGFRKAYKQSDNNGKNNKKHGRPELVKFIKEENQVRSGHTHKLRIHKGPDAASAIAFLEQNPVEDNMLYIVVETPEGNYGRNIQGIYKG